MRLDIRANRAFNGGVIAFVYPRGEGNKRYVYFMYVGPNGRPHVPGQPWRRL